MKLSWTSIAWSVVYLLLLLSFATPLSIITIFVLLLPVVILYATQTLRAFLLHIAVVWMAVFVILGPTILPLAIYFIIPALVMGHLYKKRASAYKVVIAGAGTILMQCLLLLLISTLLFDFNLTASIEEVVIALMEPLQNMTENPLSGSGAAGLWSPELAYELSSLTARMVPFTLTVCSLVLAAITHMIARPSLNSMGHTVPSLPPIRDWKLPRSLVWYYLITVLLTIFGGSTVMEGFVGTILLNLSPLLNFLFMIQAASFFFFMAYHRRWNPAIPILLIIVMFFIPILRIVGILDIATPLREFVTRPRR